MTLRARLPLLALLTCVIAISSALAGGGNKPLRVRSTLEGKKVLPLRTHWLAYPSIAAAQVSEIDFLIDGKVRWIEHSPPYNFGSDDLQGHLGFLVTTWLAAGRHSFTVRALDTTGGKASDTIVARVLSAPAPPAALKATWTRTVTDADLKKSGAGAPPAGLWKLVLDRVGAWQLDPLGSGIVNEYDVAGNVIRLYAPIQMAPLSDGKGGITRYGHHGIGGTDCRQDGPVGSYRWSVAGSELMLTAIHEICRNRRAIWEGAWTRAR